ncbi:MAG TPA: outer membrane beta-barrel protein [Gemmatimonadaceae bacterium]|nr:outer membrane beta-barrel protein [Gemmatimonadaceae bacterium]
MRPTRLALALALAAAAPLSAQSAARTGFTLSLGVGGGSAGVSCGDSCTSDRETSPSMYLRLGGAVRPNLVLAGEINGWSKSENGGTFTIGTVNAVAQYYPAASNGFYLLGGLGFGTMEAKADLGGGFTASDRANGLGYQLGAGYDWRLAPTFALTPYVGYFSTVGGKFSDGTQANGNVVQFGLGFTWR